MPTAAYIALLRAVNVGGTGKLPMTELRSACEGVGLEHVSTYIASGNIVFSSRKSAKAVHGLLTALLRDQFGMVKNDVILRRPDDLAGTIARNPFPDAARARPNLLMVAFLSGAPATSAREALAGLPGPERIHLDREHVYIDFVAGAGRSKLTPVLLERILQVRHTSRNWNTTQKLLEMGRAVEARLRANG